MKIFNKSTKSKPAKIKGFNFKNLSPGFFIWTAIGTLGAAHILKSAGKKHTGIVVGQIPSVILLLGLYNELSKKKN